MSFNLEDLEVWKTCREFRKRISILTKSFPAEEKFRLTDQIIRSSRSVTANIAEGFGRFHYQENSQFSRQGCGSLSETLDHLYVALDEEYISQIEFDQLKNDYLHCVRLINGYINYLQEQKSKLSK